MIYQAKVISLDILFYKELSNAEQTLINNNFPNPIVNKQIKLALMKFRKNEPDPSLTQTKIITPLTYSIVTKCGLIISRIKKQLKT